MGATPHKGVESSKIYEFVLNFSIPPSIPEMEDTLERSIAYSQYIGELLNDADFNYKTKYADCLNRLNGDDSETETTRKAKLEAWTAEEKRLYLNLKNIMNNLKKIQMVLFQAIKTRREESINRR